MRRHFLATLFATLLCLAWPGLPWAQAAPPGTGSPFQHGSGVAVTSLTPEQAANIATLGQVWGFLKYHHPRVTAGELPWDDELLRMLPAILAAPDRAAASAILQRWIAALGPVASCQPCTTLDTRDLQLRSALAWLDAGDLGPELRATLRDIYQNRPAGKEQYYVRHQQPVGNPVFEHEAGYPQLVFPDAGYQLLGLFRYWNMIEYWAPYRDQIGEDWHQVLRDSITGAALAKDKAAYELHMMALIARVHDTHANLWSSLQVRPPQGTCALPVRVRFIDGQAVVYAYADPQAGPATGLLPGDVIDSLDGTPVARLVQLRSPYYAASNDAARLRDIGHSLLQGTCAPARLRVRRGQEALALAAMPEPGLALNRERITHDRPGETFQRLGQDIAYLKLSSIKSDDIPAYLEAAAGTSGLIVDIRNYPNQFVVYTLGRHLVSQPVPFARFTTGDAANPGAFRWGQQAALFPAAPHYPGKVVILVDEISQSQAEYTAMALRSVPGAKVIGSTTAGADGNVSPIVLPGGLRTMISGIGVFYPDRRPTQRVGIVPDIEVRPTVDGIRAGRDEVLEAAIAELRRGQQPYNAASVHHPAAAISK
ncbi:S41 family peptidase [Oxalobacteraceae bacterium A2-2]